MMKTLSTFYKENDAFWKYDYQAHEKGFKWVRIDEEANLYAFSRYSDEQEILVVNNFNDQELYDVALNLPADTEYRLVFSSNAIPIEPFTLYVQDEGVRLTIPRLTTYYFQRVNKKGKKKNK